MVWSNLTWMLTALGAVVVLLTRVRLGGEDEHSSGVSAVNRPVLNLHTVVGVLTLGLWVAGLVTDRRALVYGGLAGWWVLTLAGLALLMRWLPSGGRHSGQKATDAWGRGAGLSMLAHIGTLVGALYFTFVVLTDRI